MIDTVTSVKDLELSVRSHRCVISLGINTVAELIQHTADEFLECKNFGICGLNEIREKLSLYQLCLKGEEDLPEVRLNKPITSSKKATRQPTFAERVCRTLEGLALLEWTPKNESFQDEVYKFCHLVPQTCPNPHDDWMKQFLETEKLVNEAMAAPLNKREKECSPE